MTLTQCVVHELLEEPGHTSASVHYSQAPLPPSAELNALLAKLNRSFGGSRVINARFDDSPGKLLYQEPAYTERLVEQ